jgi:hypothetical protein
VLVLGHFDGVNVLDVFRRRAHMLQPGSEAFFILPQLRDDSGQIRAIRLKPAPQAGRLPLDGLGQRF